MSATYPPLPPELVEFAGGGVSILVGTCGPDLAPDCVRGVGVRIWPGACQATILVPAGTSRTSIANLRANPRLAVTLSRIHDLRTFQLKGTVTAIRDGDDDDHERSRRYREAFTESLAFVGQHPDNTLRLTIWPSIALDLDIELIFSQSPGPAAGTRYAGERP